jgi:hypothetical protein
MNMIHHPEAQYSQPLECPESGQDYIFTIRISVEDAGLLWRTAAAHLLSAGVEGEEELTELIGPYEDPEIADCISLLLGPQQLPGVHYKTTLKSPNARKNFVPCRLSGHEK